MSLKSRLKKRVKLAKARLDNFEPPNPSLKPLHTNPFIRSRVLLRKGYKRDKQAVKSELCDG